MFRCARALLLAALAFLCGALLREARAQAPAGPVVGSVQFVGRVNVPEETLRAAIALAPGMPFSGERLEADRKALLALGYFRSVGAAHRAAGNRVDVTFRLVEWPKVLHIRILGNTVVDLRTLQQAIGTRVGQVLCAPQLQNDIRALEQIYRDRGYVARVSEELLDEAARSGILRFEIREIRIDEVRVEGGTPELQERARRELRELPPRLYRPDDVAQERERLLKVRGIREAVPKVEVDGPGRVRIRWLLNPAPEPDASATG